MKRRNFLNLTGLSTTAFFIPGFLKSFQYNHSSILDGKRLIVLQLSGGNDGLNTIIPYKNDIYYQLRPTIAIAKEKVLKLNDDSGLHPSLLSLQKIYDEGEMLLINNVGYPNPDRSHFRSMDIWQTASNSDEYWNTGWLGRSLDAFCKNCDLPYYAIELDDSLSLVSKGKERSAFAVSDPQKIYKTMKDEDIQKIINQYEVKNDNSSLDFLYKTIANTASSASYIYEKSKIYSSKFIYPNHKFGKYLKTIAELINSGIETRVFYSGIDGFDTHVRQQEQHGRLLKIVSESLLALRDDLKQNNQWNNTVVMVFSEFGRRAKQNGSNGTDHGTANNVWILGGDLKAKGLYNPLSDLSKLENNDLIHSIDFRSIYATLLDKVIGIDHTEVLKRPFEVIPFI